MKPIREAKSTTWSPFTCQFAEMGGNMHRQPAWRARVFAVTDGSTTSPHPPNSWRISHYRFLIRCHGLDNAAPPLVEPVFDQPDRVAPGHMLRMIGICWSRREALNFTLRGFGGSVSPTPRSRRGSSHEQSWTSFCLVSATLSDGFATVDWASMTTPLLCSVCNMGTSSGPLMKKHNANSARSLHLPPWNSQKSIEALPMHPRFDAKDRGSMPLPQPSIHVDRLDVLASSTRRHTMCANPTISVPVFSGASSSNNRG